MKKRNDSRISVREVLSREEMVPARIVLTKDSGLRVLERMRRPRRPTAAMRKLFAKRDD